MNARMLKIAGIETAPGAKSFGHVRIGELADGSAVQMPVAVIHGAEAGPRMFLTAGLHGTEVEGVEAARRLIRELDPKVLRGVLVVVPVVNVLGFRSSPGARYSPPWLEEEAREIDNAFPGNREGSAIDRAAAIVMQEILIGSDFGIDFHCGRISIVNMPHVRTYAASDCPDAGELLRMMEAYGSKIVLSIPRPRNNIQYWASKHNVPTIMIETGGGLTVGEDIVVESLDGIQNIMAAFGMLDKPALPPMERTYLKDEFGICAPAGGFFEPTVCLGDMVKAGQVVARISDVFGCDQCEVVTPGEGLVFGLRIAPTVFEGIKLMNIGAPA
jgi:hypothetical protein